MIALVSRFSDPYTAVIRALQTLIVGMVIWEF